MRVRQADGRRGSLRSVQRLIGQHRELADATLRSALTLDSSVLVDWRSPLSIDDNAEYRDTDFLERLELGRLSRELETFWPRGGPQWDALARLSDGKVVLLEAKAHTSELRSSCSASPRSLELIRKSLAAAQRYFGGHEGSDWTQGFYQYANRLAHLYFLRSQNVDAELVFLYFLNDAEMRGPSTIEQWKEALGEVHHALGLPSDISNVHDCFVDSTLLT